ncbi:MAG TPA: hypothetical protein VG273_09255 [Bryobacteraceae bacterium]|jgi:hypothetical protein|nr:hypothetical protein [Bryobacteraceae bacterium]
MADLKQSAGAQETITGHTPASTESLKTAELPQEKRKYSRRTRGAQEIERGISKAAASMGDAVAATFTTYKERSRASSFKKRDGAVKDAVKNWTKAYSKGIKEASDVPYQFVKTVNKSKASKQIRDAVKMFSPPMFR